MSEENKEEYGDIYDDDQLRHFDGISKSKGSHRTYIDIESKKSVRPQYNRRDYTAFRPGEAVPTRHKKIVKMCMEAYDNVGLIRHIIDLMGDFVCQGVSIVHSNKEEERFWQRWFKEIDGQERSERFSNYLYRSGNVIVRRTNAKIKPKQFKDFKSNAAGFEDPKYKHRVIPWKYEFLNPMAVDYDQNNKLVMHISKETSRKMFKGNINKKTIPIDMKRTRLFYYKRDDWLPWANPMVRPILDDILMLEKMKLADLAALDGAISNVRLWTLGDLEHKITPKPAAINKLRDILASHVGGGTMDMIWGPDLKFTESNSQIYKFLGDAKYGPVLNGIYVGMGIPPALTGGSGASGFTNNQLSLKTLIERLEYGRKRLTSFWEYEIRLVQKAMGFKTAPKLHFTNITLSDEASLRTLLISLADRNIVSHETLLDRIGEIPEIEQSRIREEQAGRDAGQDPVKVSPYHNANHLDEVIKLAMTTDTLNSEEYFEKLGIPYQEPAVIEPGGDNSKPGNKNVNRPGRPPNSKDTGPRKKRQPKPRASILWAINAQKEIASTLGGTALNYYKKKNLRSLSREEFAEFEEFKLSVLLSLDSEEKVNADTIAKAVSNIEKVPDSFKKQVNYHKSAFIASCDKEPNIEDMRNIYAIVFEAFC